MQPATDDVPHARVLSVGETAARSLNLSEQSTDAVLHRARDLEEAARLLSGEQDYQLLVLGPDIADAARASQQLLGRFPGLQLLFLVEPDKLASFRASLPFIPRLGSAWTASLDEDSGTLWQLAQEAAATARKRSDAQSMRRKLNEQLLRGSRRPEAELRAARHRLSEEYFSTLLHAAPDGFVALDSAGAILAANPAARTMLGLDAEGPGATLGAVIAAGDRHRLEAALGQAAAGQEVRELEFGIAAGASQARWLELSLSPVAEREANQVIAGTLRDISARRAEDRKRQALVELADRSRTCTEPADIAFAAAEILGRTLGVSRAGYGTVDPVAETITVERDWNAPGIESLAGVHNFRDFGSSIENLKRGETVVFADAERDPRTAANADALKAISAQSVVNVPVSEANDFVALLYLNHAGPREWPEEELSFVREVAERTRSAVERRRAEQELQALASSLEQQVSDRTARLMEAEEALRQSQKMEAVGQLTGGIAHDFNNLLTIIVGNIDAARRHLGDQADGRVSRAIANALTGANRAATLTQRLLAFSRRQPLAPKPTDANRLVTGMSDLLHRTLGEMIELETVLSPRLWQVEVDANQLENAILNLAVNARDAMPAGGKLTIETANTHLDRRYAASNAEVAPGHYVAICISDSGSGMDPATIAKAIEPFFTTKEVGKGTGLGLSMVYGFVKQSGGHLKIYSEPGEGTTVRIYLPRLKAAARIEDEESDVLIPEGSGSETVLVVEDDEEVRAYTVGSLEELGYRVIDAPDGPAALELLRNEDSRIDLLFTDVVLPKGMTGADVAREARALKPDLKILFTSGYARDAITHQGRLDAGVELLTKPFSYGDLAARVRDVLDAPPAG